MVYRTLFLIGGACLGFLLFWGSVAEQRKRRMISTTPTSKIRSLAIGLVEIKGSPEEFQETLKTPFSKTDCFHYIYEIQRESEDSEGNKTWGTMESGTKAVPFYLNDGTGKVLVDPDTARFNYTEKNEYVFESYDEVPEKMKEYLETRDQRFDDHWDTMMADMLEFTQATDSKRVGSAEISNDRKRKYVEKYLPADAEDIYVFGSAVRRPNASAAKNVKNLVIKRKEGDPMFRISNKSEKEEMSKKSNIVLWGIVSGLVVTVGSFAGAFYLFNLLQSIVILAVGLGAGYLFQKRLIKGEVVKFSE